MEQRDTKLGDVFDFLPYGLVYKEETGLGATTLELTCQRNSIIVEPIKITASSKAHHHNALYVGSETDYHDFKTYKEDILNYVNNEAIAYKKIVVVADSLRRLHFALEGKVQDYFLLIDEIDSFQLDSSYRRSMEECLDIYKSFPEEKRAMVSATFLDFSDPALTGEKRTQIKYDKPTSRKIDLYFAPHKIRSIGVKRIAQLCNAHLSDKLLIAYNSVTGCYNMAKHLTKHHHVADTDIKILCSKNSEEKVGQYFAGLNSKELPGKINFITSAYFTGFDLSERYHLISISGNKSRVHSLSDKRLKQIAGRCRHKDGLLSESIIYDLVKEKDKAETPYSVEDMLDLATKEIKALECIEQNYVEHPLLRQTIDNIRSLITENTTSHGYRFVRIRDTKPLISYLSLDAYKESIRVRNELYTDKETLPSILRAAGHEVKEKYLKSDEEIEENAIEKNSRSEQINVVIEKLKPLHKITSPGLLTLSVGATYTPFQKQIIWKLEDLHLFIDRDQFLELLRKAGESRDSRKLNSLFLAAFFFTLNPASLYKRLVFFHIPIGQTFTGEQLLEKWNTIFLEGGLLKKLKSATQAVRFTKLHYVITRRKGDAAGHYIKSENPFKLTLYNYRPYREGEKALWSPLLYADLDQLSGDNI